MVKLSRTKSSGFTLIETMVAIAVLAVLVGLAVPNLREFLLNRSVRSVAEGLLSGARTAQQQAINSNSLIEFRPVENWTVRAMNSATNIAASNSAVDGTSIADVTAGTTGTIVYNSVGGAQRNTGTNATPVLVPIPAAPMVYRVSAAGAKTMCVYIAGGGAAKLCDPSFTSPDPRSCQPAITATACPV